MKAKGWRMGFSSARVATLLNIKLVTINLRVRKGQDKMTSRRPSPGRWQAPKNARLTINLGYIRRSRNADTCADAQGNHRPTPVVNTAKHGANSPRYLYNVSPPADGGGVYSMRLSRDAEGGSGWP